MPEEWVAESTWFYEAVGMLYEAGGIYQTEPEGTYPATSRKLVPGEHVAECPRCGQRFAGVDEGTAEACRDLHFDGDADCPSICRSMPARRLRLVESR